MSADHVPRHAGRASWEGPVLALGAVLYLALVAWIVAVSA